MGLLDGFRRPPPIVDRASLREFLDTRAAFLSRKSVFDDVRGRSGPYFPMIIREESFKVSVEEDRRKNYPYGLFIVAERVKDIPLPFAHVFFDNMPIHKKPREQDFELIRNQLRVNLVSMHRDFVKSADLPAVASAIEPAAGETAA